MLAIVILCNFCVLLLCCNLVTNIRTEAVATPAYNYKTVLIVTFYKPYMLISMFLGFPECKLSVLHPENDHLEGSRTVALTQIKDKSHKISFISYSVCTAI